MVCESVKKQCADAVLTNAIEALANTEGIPLGEARTRLICSRAYTALYDFETELWKEGPDYLLDFYEKTKDLPETDQEKKES